MVSMTLTTFHLSGFTDEKYSTVHWVRKPKSGTLSSEYVSSEHRHKTNWKGDNFTEQHHRQHNKEILCTRKPHNYIHTYACKQVLTDPKHKFSFLHNAVHFPHSWLRCWILFYLRSCDQFISANSGDS